jgi:hypothetical protein
MCVAAGRAVISLSAQAPTARSIGGPANNSCLSPESIDQREAMTELTWQQSYSRVCRSKSRGSKTTNPGHSAVRIEAGSPAAVDVGAEAQSPARLIIT